jgi:hypothetical protein
MARLSGPAKGKWFDPSNGVSTVIAEKRFANKGTQTFTPPEKNHDGDSDWVLLLDASK